MSDLISRQALLEHLKRTIGDYHEDFNDGIDASSQTLSSQAERKTGQRKLQTIMWKELVYCSECGFEVHVEETRRYNYCPNCGAYMRGEKDE